MHVDKTGLTISSVLPPPRPRPLKPSTNWRTSKQFVGVGCAGLGAAGASGHAADWPEGQMNTGSTPDRFGTPPRCALTRDSNSRCHPRWFV